MKKIVENYQLNDIISSDSYTTFYHGIDITNQNAIVLRMMEMPKLTACISDPISLIKEEVNILTSINNTNVIKIIQVVQTKNNIYMVYEGFTNGLLKNILTQRKYIPEFEALDYLYQIFTAYKELYDKKIILKSIRLDSIGINNDKVIKLIDIGLIKNLEKNNRIPNLVNETLLKSLAPEIYFGHQFDNKCDVFTIGNIFYQMTFGQEPWSGKTVEEYFLNVMNKPINFQNKYQKLTRYSQYLIAKMLDRKVETRAGWHEIFDDDILKKFKMSESVMTRELKLLEKIERKPDSWQVASMKLNQDPLIQLNAIIKTKKDGGFQSEMKSNIKELASVEKSSFDKQNKSMMNPANQPNVNANIEKNKGKVFVPSIDQTKIPINIGTNPKLVTQPTIPARYSMGEGKASQDLVITNDQHRLISSEINIKPLSTEAKPSNNMASTKTQVNNPNYLQNLKCANNLNIFTNFLTKNEKVSKAQCFDQNTSRLMKLFHKFSIYSIAATTATKLFKTDLIVVQCYFLYKKLAKTLKNFSNDLSNNAINKNKFNLQLYQEYQNSDVMLEIIKNIEDQFDAVMDIYKKLLKNCREKIKLLKVQKFDIETIAKYINDDIQDVEEPFYSTILPYLERFLMTADNIIDPGTEIILLRHKIEIVCCLLLSKMETWQDMEGIFNMEELLLCISSENHITMDDYLKTKIYELKLFEGQKNML